MNAYQTRYTRALAALESCKAAAEAKYPEEPTGDAAATEEAWEAHVDAVEAIDDAEGVPAARKELLDAEVALIGWGKTTPTGRASKLDFDEAARWPDFRKKLCAILVRA